MKKDVTYYLEDTSRLKEISQFELDSWIAEMPFHQPLQLLAGIKYEMEENQENKNQKIYAAYFAEDYETLRSMRSKRKDQRNKNTKQLAKTIDLKEKSADSLGKAKLEEDIESAAERIHNNADSDTDEMSIPDVNPEFEKAQVKNELSSDLANDLNEELIFSEILEEDISPESILHLEESIESDIVSEITEETLVQDEKDIDVLRESEETIAEPLLSDPNEVDKPTKVDYSEYSMILPKKKEKATKSSFDEVQNSTDELNTSEIEQNSSLDKNDQESEQPLTTRRTKKKKVKIKKKVKEESLEKKKKVKKKKKKKGSTPKEDIKKLKKIKKDKSKKKKKKDNKKDKIKGLVGKAQKRKTDKKHKKHKKAKPKKEDKQVEYVIIDSAKATNFKLKDYDGVSNYTSWLLQQESINDVKTEQYEIAQAEKKKSKKKKSKKKKKSLKAAVDSIKKQDSIISEPLANILASQGHKKKARKMYAKLALVFPEKKSYFEEKIEALKH